MSKTKPYQVILIEMLVLTIMSAHAATITPNDRYKTEYTTSWTKPAKEGDKQTYTVGASASGCSFITSSISAGGGAILTSPDKSAENPPTLVGSASAKKDVVHTDAPNAKNFTFWVEGNLTTGGNAGSPLHWKVTLEQKFFWLTASSTIGEEGKSITITANGAPTESTWTINNKVWKDWNNGNSNPYKTSSITLNRDMWDKMKWSPVPVPDGYLFPTANVYNITATTTEAEGARSASITVYVVGVRIKQGNTDITNTTHDEIIGKKISLTGEVIPSSLKITKHEWSIPGTRIKNYEATVNKTTLTELEGNDLSTSSVNYYWVDGANKREVKYTVTTDSQKISGKAVFNVKEPTSTLTATIGDVRVTEVTKQDNRALVMGLLSESGYGLTLTSSLVEPTGFTGGQGQFWQVIVSSFINFYNEKYQNIIKTGVLDGSLPYASLPTLHDSPHLELPSDCNRVVRADAFRTWIMYKPAGNNTIWVPLRSVQWYWNGTAEQTDGSWTLISGKRDTQNNQITTDFPSWGNEN